MSRLDPRRFAAVLDMLGQLHAQQSGGGGGGGYAPSVSLPAPTYGFGQSKGGGGHHGFSFGDILGGLGNALTTPLAAVTSAVNEVGELGANKKERAAGHHASFSDLFNQVYHPKQRLTSSDILFGNKDKKIADAAGYGKHVHGWQRAALGLGTDIAVDPLTYIAPIGKLHGGQIADEIAQSTARQTAAAAAVHAGLDAVPKDAAEVGRLIEQFGHMPDIQEIVSKGEAATALARRTGVSKLTPEMIDQFLTREGAVSPLADRGLQLFGRHSIPGVKIPLTDVGPGAKFGELFASGKAAAADKIAGSAGKVLDGEHALTMAARSGDPRAAFEAVMTKLQRGTIDPAAQGMATSWGSKFSKLVKGFSEDDLAQLPKALEGDPAAVAALDGRHAGVRSLLDEIHGRLVKAGANITQLADYSPRELTAEGRRVLSDAGLLSGSGGFSPLASFEKARTLVPDAAGNYKFLGETFQAANNAEVTAKVAEIAKAKLAAVDPKAAEEMAGFFNPDIKQAVQHYIGRASNRVASMDAASRLYGAGIGTALDVPAVASRVASTASAAEGVANQSTRAAQLLSEAPEATQARVAGLQAELTKATAAVESGEIGLTAKQRPAFEEWSAARQEQIDAATARLSTKDPEALRGAAYAETAAETRAALATSGQNGAELALNLSDPQKRAVAEAIREGVFAEIRAGIGTPQHVADMLTHAEKLKDPGFLLAHYDRVVNWIKAYQIATPGFHTRNLMGGVFNNSLANVDVMSYREFLRTWAKLAAGKEGSLDAALVERFRSVESAIGRGQIGSEGFLREATGHGPARANLWVRGSQGLGNKVEDALRGTLAWDVLKKGGSVEDAVAAVNKFHFNYGDLSKFELGAKRVMPFYTWTRKNLPLQIEMIQRNPKVYARFFHLKNDVEAMSTPDQTVPGYFKDLTAVRMPWQHGGGHVYWTPDLPFKDLQKPFDPIRETIGMATPVIKTPVEMWAGKQFFKDLPLSGTKWVPAPVPALLVKGIGPALTALGVAEERDGHLFMTEKNAYALEQFVPVLARYRRMLPKEQKYETKRMTTILSFLGFGTRTNSLDEQSLYASNQVKYSKRASTARAKALQKAVDEYNKTNGG